MFKKTSQFGRFLVFKALFFGALFASDVVSKVMHFALFITLSKWGLYGAALFSSGDCSCRTADLTDSLPHSLPLQNQFQNQGQWKKCFNESKSRCFDGASISLANTLQSH